ncbi:MAG TPA: T9SS type A sorting domain-containing protein [Salinimicrobium sp.]|nr:T9SS type A sorting domain-containing protein [Salinimicrobium sp.]
MKKITLFLLMFLPFIGFSQTYTTPNEGTSYTLEDIMQLSPTTISFDGTNYTLSEALVISETDSLIIDQVLTLLIDPEILIDVHGTFISDAGDQEIIINASDETAPYEGFWFYEESEVLINNTNIQHGGGLKVITPDFTLTNSYLAHNVAGASTGAVVSLSNGSPLIEGNTFILNDMPAVGSGANQNVSARIIGNHIEFNGQANENRPQINLGPTGTDTLQIIQNTIIGDPTMIKVGGIAVSNFFGGEIRAIIDNNVIRDNRYGITIAGGNAFSYIRGNVIEDNNTQGIPLQGGSGISLNASNDTQNIIASDNEFRGNLWGITLIDEASINLGDDEDNPGGNIFSGNGNGGVTYALYNNTDNTIMAKHNCWTEEIDMTLEEAEEVIVHSVDDSSLGTVIFDPVSCASLGVNDVLLQEFVFVPNPAFNQISFLNTPKFNKLQIFDLTGKLVKEQVLNPDLNEVSLELSSGLYIVQFSNGRLNLSKKLIVK